MQKTNLKIALSHPSGNPNVKGVLMGLQNNNLLHSFNTSIACFPNSSLEKLAKLPLFKDFKRRSFDTNIRQQTHTYPYKELGRLLSQKLKFNRLLTHETSVFSTDKCCQYIDNKVAGYIQGHNDISGIYAYEDCAISQFNVAKQRGIKCIYDLPISYWKYGTQLMKEEALRLPEWAITLGGGINDSDEKHERKVRELESADIVVCASRFVKESLPEWARNKPVIQVPFGTPGEMNTGLKYVSEEKPLRLLFVGSMGQRKGLGDLFNAIKIVNTKNIELVVLGSLLAPIEFYKKQLTNFTYEPVRPHNQVLELMRTCDIFCLPSIAEGRALVMQEAMSQGLPIIITPNTGGEDLVVENETGFLVPIRSPFAIAEKINWFLENRKQIAAMGEKAKQHTSYYTWEKYGNSIAKKLQEYL
ncbi:hypothetical protein FACS189446_1020 [Bacteroidia bacterium]|nr:hypothetical protein FACS189446_1020 [Bacteroidia bacterium]